MPGHQRGTIAVGDEVFTRDGEKLGVVSERHGETHFKVDAPMARDYWLACELLIEPGAGRAPMDFDADDLEAYQLDQPSPTVANDPRIDAGTDDGLSGEDRRQRQEEMKSGYPDAVGRSGDLRPGAR